MPLSRTALLTPTLQGKIHSAVPSLVERPLQCEMLPDTQFDKEASQFKGVIVVEGQPTPLPDVSYCNILQALGRTNITT